MPISYSPATVVIDAALDDTGITVSANDEVTWTVNGNAEQGATVTASGTSAISFASVASGPGAIGLDVASSGSGSVGVRVNSSSATGIGIQGEGSVSGSVAILALQSHSGAIAFQIQNSDDKIASFSFSGAADRAIVFGDLAGTVVLDTATQTLTLKTMRGFRTESTSAGAITTTRALALNDSGGVFSVAQTSSYDIDLPSPTTGMGTAFDFYLTSPGSFDVTITVAGAAASFVGTIVNDITSVLPATGSTLTFKSGVSVLGDNIRIQAISTGLYLVRAVASVNGSITIT